MKTQINSEREDIVNIHHEAKIQVYLSSSCLIKGHQGQSCTHHGCFLTERNPKYHSIRNSEEFTSRRAFTQFKRHESYNESFWLTAVNPFTKGNKEWHTFEGFRQAWPFETAGEWPTDRVVFDRSEVSFVYLEYETAWPTVNAKGEIVQHYKKDVKEFAVFRPAL